MANTFKKIQTVTVGSGGAASIAFTSIPQTYTDLKVILSTRSTSGAANARIVRMKLNNLTTSIYSNIAVEGDGSTAYSFSASGTDTAVRIGLTNDSGATASVFSSVEVYIPNYTSSNSKSASADIVTENNATQAYQELNAFLVATSAAITDLTFTPETLAGNFAQYSTATLYGVANVTASSSAYATGGNQIYTDNTYWYHVFTSSGTFTPARSLTCDYLVVAGGGPGGTSGISGGGGGAGGLRSTVTATGGGGSLESPLSLTATAYTVTIGAGGAVSTNGSNSVFGSITSTGGGQGAAWTGNGTAGGSGGGASNYAGTTSGAGTTNQGYRGGNYSGSYSSPYGSPGGGGAGVTGGDMGSGATQPTNGGNGVAVSISGTSVTYAGGGGGGSYETRSSGGLGGSGGGGAGANGPGNGIAGTANTGGGGGGEGGFGSTDPGIGGSGIVIVRYAR